MKTKILSLFLFTAILTIAMVSATITITVPELSQAGNSVDITIQNDVAGIVTFTGPDDIVQDGKTISFTNPGTFDILLADTDYTVTIDYDVDADFDFDLENTYDTTLTTTKGLETVDTTLTFEKTFCSVANDGNLDISSVEFDVLEGFGDDEDFWYPLDEIELTFDVENKGDYDIDNVEIKICVFDEDDDTCIFNEDDFDLSDDDFNLDEDDDEIEITATLTIDPDELKSGNNDYTIYINAEGEIDDSDSPNDGDVTCISDSEKIDIRTDEEFIIFSDAVFSSDPTLCGEEVTLDFEVWNVGDKDIDDDEIFVWVHDNILGLDEKIIFSKGIDKLDKEQVSITFEIPKDADEKTYFISIRAYDDDRYSESDLYENTEDDESEINVFLKVEGNCAGSVVSSAQITAELDSETPEAIKGKQVIVKSTIKNTGTDTTTYTISVFGNSAWSSLSAIDPQVVTLDAGESKDISIFLNIDEEAEGEQEFTIKATYGEQTTEQKVALSIEKGVTQDVVVEHLRENWFIYVIALINIILIIAIIAVVKSMVGRVPAAR